MIIVNKHFNKDRNHNILSSDLMASNIVIYDVLNMSDYEVLTESIITSTIHNASCQLFENLTGCVDGNITEEDTGSEYFYKVHKIRTLNIITHLNSPIFTVRSRKLGWTNVMENTL